MEDKFLYQYQEGAQSCFDESKKRKKVIEQFQPIEYFDLIPLDKEKESSSNDSEDDCKQIFFIKRKKKIPKKTKKDQDDIFIKDLIINKEEPIVKEDNQDTWEFTEGEEFFKQKNQSKENILDNKSKFLGSWFKGRRLLFLFSSFIDKHCKYYLQRFKETVITP